jgi:putative transposase
MHRTLRLCLDPTPEQADVLAETARQFTLCFNLVCAYGWQEHEKNGVQLHLATYRASKHVALELVSDLHIQARVKVTEALKSAFARHKKGLPVSCPSSHACPPRYNVHTYRVDWETRTVNVSTTKGREHIPFRVPAHAGKYAGYAVATADLVRKCGRWYLHVVTNVPEPEVMPTDVVVGVDLGVTRPAVSSDNRFHGERRWRELEARDFRLRRKLPKRGTKSAKPTCAS